MIAAACGVAGVPFSGLLDRAGPAGGEFTSTLGTVFMSRAHAQEAPVPPPPSPPPSPSPTAGTGGGAPPSDADGPTDADQASGSEESPGDGPPLSDESVDALARFEDRPIREVRLAGLEKVDAGLVQNTLRSRVGQPLRIEGVREDVVRLNRLGRFRNIDARAQTFDDGSVTLIYEFVENPTVTDIQVVGNRQVSDQELAGELAAAISLVSDIPIDQTQIDRGKRSIENLYRKKGYYLAQVSVDESELRKTGILLYRIREGDRIKVTDIRFDGNASFSPRELRPSLKTKTWGIFETGPLDDDVLNQDVASLIAFYKDRGYLDVRADKQVLPSPNAREARVTFLVEEGPVYTLRRVRAEMDDGRNNPSGDAPTVFSVEQLAGIMQIKAGDVYSLDRLRKSVKAVQEAYWRLGYADVRVDRAEVRVQDRPEVDIILIVSEGPRSLTGQVEIAGNDLTQQKVIRRHVSIKPERPLDVVALKDSEQRIRDTRLFNLSPDKQPKITIQPVRPGAEVSEDGLAYRDVLVEIEETNTGSLSFGAAVSSDSGVFGTVSLTQRNFDIADFPDSFEEFIRGRSFRGAGQTFDITLQPGTEFQNYSISLADPYLLETEYSGSVSGSYRTRQYSQYDEDRLSLNLGLGRRFGERWTGTLTTRLESIDLRDIDADAPVDVFAVEDQHTLSGLGVRFARTTADSRIRPTKGTRLELAAEQVGVFGGDFDFTRLGFEHILFLTINEDFLGRKTVLSVKTAASYIPQDQDDVPVYERFYLGGRSFRGFRFRSISPKGIQNDTGELGDDPVGGIFSFFFGPEIEQPIVGESLALAFFIDSGTVDSDVTFDNYRLSAGMGLRLYIPQLSQAPLAFDFGFPIVKHFGDRERVFSFSVDIPF